MSSEEFPLQHDQEDERSRVVGTMLMTVQAKREITIVGSKASAEERGKQHATRRLTARHVMDDCFHLSRDIFTCQLR